MLSPSIQQPFLGKLLLHLLIAVSAFYYKGDRKVLLKFQDSYCYSFSYHLYLHHHRLSSWLIPSTLFFLNIPGVYYCSDDIERAALEFQFHSSFDMS